MQTICKLLFFKFEFTNDMLTMEFPNEITYHITSFLDTCDLFNFRLTCSHNNEVYKRRYRSSILKQMKYRSIIVIAKSRNYYKFDNTCMRRSTAKYTNRFVSGGGDTCDKWNDPSMTKIKVVVNNIDKIEKSFTCILIAPIGIRIKIAKFMIASYFMRSPADYVIHDESKNIIDNDYNITDQCHTMFLTKHVHIY